MKNHFITETRRYVVILLSEELPAGYYFHNLDHTVSVVNAVTLLAEKESISAFQKETLILAAWFHDTGYIRRYEGHEQVSMELAEDFLKDKNYPIEKIKEVLKHIETTHLSFKPSLKTEMIIKDADSFHLGSPDYFLKLRTLRKEWRELLGQTFSDNDWLALNLNFLTSHSYYTIYCQNHLDRQKHQNINAIKKLIA